VLHVGASLAGASPGSHVRPSPARASPGSHVGTSQPSQLPWAARGLVFMYCTCELGIMCIFGCVFVILDSEDIWSHFWMCRLSFINTFGCVLSDVSFAIYKCGLWDIEVDLWFV
jgi:hypothetical protein